MLDQRLRRWPSIKTFLFQRVVFAEAELLVISSENTLYHLSVSMVTRLTLTTTSSQKEKQKAETLCILRKPT